MQSVKMDKKKVLKSAREAIQQKNFQEALQLCTTVLSSEEDYMALVFGGLCHAELGDVGNAKAFYLRASKLEPEKLPAWQGLYKLYDDDKIFEDESLLECCQKLISSVGSDAEKLSSYERTLAKCLLKLDRFIELKEFVEQSRQSDVIAALVVSQLASRQDLSTDAVQLCRKCFSVLRAKAAIDEPTLLLESSFSFEHEPLEIWFAVSSECFAASGSIADQARLVLGFSMQLLLDQEIDSDLMSRVSTAATDTTILTLIEAVRSLSAGDFAGVLACAEKMDRKLESTVGLARQLLLLPSLLHFHRFDEAEEMSKSSISAIGKMSADYSALLSKLTFRQCQALYGVHSVESLEKCLVLLRSKDDQASKILLAYVAADSGKTDEAWRVLSDCNDGSADYLCAVAWCHLVNKNTEEAKTNCLKALMMDGGDQRAWIHFVMGRALWDGGRRDAVVLKEFLQAAKLDAHHGDAFYYLGAYYLHDNRDPSRAVRCLERAAVLQPKSELVARALNDAYCQTKEMPKQLDLLARVAASFPIDECTWARLQLGLLLSAAGRPSEAVEVLQALIRVLPNDAEAWQSLGDAYEARGSYESAVKCFERVVALRPNDCAYATTRAAAIDVHIGAFEAAIEACRSVLVHQPDQLLASSLMSEALIKLAALHYEDARYERALDDLVVFFNCSAKLVALSDSICAWKLLGDGCMLLARFGDVRVAGLRSQMPDGWKLTSCLMAVKKAVHCYSKAVNRGAVQMASVWHDLAVALLHVIEFDSSDSKRDVADQAVVFLKKAISLAESEQLASVYWTTLGAAMHMQKKAAVAQHCFVRALQLDKCNASAYCHLGLLYLSNGNVNLAHEALSNAQSADPSIAASWCCQAVIADMVDHHDRVDLFRHTLQLSNLPMAAKNYAYFVLNNLLSDKQSSTDEKHVSSICTARDALQKLTALLADDSDCLVPLSLLMEREAMCSLALSQLSGKTPADDVNVIRLKIKLAIECSENLSHVDSATRTLLTRIQSLFSANPDKLSDLLSASSTELGTLLGELKSGTVVDSGNILTQSTSSDLLSTLLIAAELGSLKLTLPSALKSSMMETCPGNGLLRTTFDDQKAPEVTSQEEGEIEDKVEDKVDTAYSPVHPTTQHLRTLLLALQGSSAINIQRILHERPWLFHSDHLKVIAEFLKAH